MTTIREAEPAELTVHLPCDDTAAATARGLLDDFLARHAVHEVLRDDAVLVLHELVVNGLVHGEPDERNHLEVSVGIGDGLVSVSILDHGSSGTVEAKPFTEDLLGGRGLSLVAGLSESWSVDRSSGTRVSAVLAL